LIVIGWFLRAQADASYSQLITRSVFVKTPIATVMETGYHAVYPQTDLLTLLHEYVLQYHTRYYPVSVDGDFRGLVSVSDFGKFPREEWGQRTVAEAMTPAHRLHTLAPGDSLNRAVELMATGNVNQLPVLEDSRLLGFVTRAGIIQVMQVRQEVGIEASAEQSAVETTRPG
jgi:CBS domain-containing protein